VMWQSKRFDLESRTIWSHDLQMRWAPFAKPCGAHPADPTKYKFSIMGTVHTLLLLTFLSTEYYLAL
jgi:hypothetical protein